MEYVEKKKRIFFLLYFLKEYKWCFLEIIIGNGKGYIFVLYG